MWTNFQASVVSATAFAMASVMGPIGCSSLPGKPEQQGAVIGGASGAAVGAAVTKNRALGAIIGGAVGAAGGYVVGANKEKILGQESERAREAEKNSETTPATVEQARNAVTADVNGDGYVTLDEVVALEQTGISDEQLIEKLRATNQVFTLTDEQKNYLVEKGVSRNVIDRMTALNQNTVDQTPRPDESVIGRRSPGTL